MIYKQTVLSVYPSLARVRVLVSVVASSASVCSSPFDGSRNNSYDRHRPPVAMVLQQLFALRWRRRFDHEYFHDMHVYVKFVSASTQAAWAIRP